MPTLRHHHHAPQPPADPPPGAGRCLPASTAHPAQAAADLARRITAEYAPLGAPVVDAMCGIGTTVVEAATQGAVASELSWSPAGPTWPAVPAHALPGDRAGPGEIRVGGKRR